MNFFKRLFNKKKQPQTEEFTQEQHEQDYELKGAGLEALLGPMHDVVGHAIIPFAVGGAVDMYYFNEHLPGTGFATMELLDPNGNGPKPNRLGTYELVAFTRYNFDNLESEETAFQKIERRICGVFTQIGFYSSNAVLNPLATCEVPNGDEPNVCVVLDKYPAHDPLMIGNREHHLLLCLQIHRSELDFARREGSDELIRKLKEAGVYPYSDLDREPIV